MPNSGDVRRRLRELAAHDSALVRGKTSVTWRGPHLHVSTGVATAVAGSGLIILGGAAQLAGIGALGVAALTGTGLRYVARWIIDR